MVNDSFCVCSLGGIIIIVKDGQKVASKDWVSELRNASTVNEATEIFLVCFEGATTNNKILENKILHYSARIGSHYQDAEKRREYANTYYNMFAY